MTNFPVYFDSPLTSLSEMSSLDQAAMECPWVFLECDEEAEGRHIWFGVRKRDA